MIIDSFSFIRAFTYLGIPDLYAHAPICEKWQLVCTGPNQAMCLFGIGSQEPLRKCTRGIEMIDQTWDDVGLSSFLKETG